ncbi:peritrophin-1-like [Penaeus monodon]|uniref:peritrophin-1-like n=1 Tax=Penaeus monodon TaxID=6687 RepID=UPI0018A7CC32|nr:peritrophin-1-like [Penaeus monodon]
MKTYARFLKVSVVAENCFLSFAGSPTPNIHICHSLTCPGQDGFYAHPTFCTDYVHCVAGVPYVKRCPSNLNFNAVKGACDHPRDAHCAPFKKSCELTIPFVPGGVTDDLVTCDCEGPCIKPHPYNCDAFYHCDAVSTCNLFVLFFLLCPCCHLVTMNSFTQNLDLVRFFLSSRLPASLS